MLHLHLQLTSGTTGNHSNSQKEVVKEVVVTATPEPKAEGAVTVIRLGSGDSGEGLNPHHKIIAAFEKENPDIIVQLEAVAGADYYARLFTQIASGDAPDIMQIGDDAFRISSPKAQLSHWMTSSKVNIHWIQASTCLE